MSLIFRPQTEKRKIGPVYVDVLESIAAIDTISVSMRRQEPILVTFSNAHTVNIARNDSELRKSLEMALVLNDGAGLDLASQILYGEPFPENLNGTDFCPKLLEAAGSDARVYLLGGEAGIAEKAAAEICLRYPYVTVVGSRNGYFDPKESEQILEEVLAAGANLLLVGMGQPRQEIWAAQHFASFPGAVICVGALLDFLAGKFPRAPMLIRKMRLEWAFRLFKEPRRLARRYLIGNFLFVATTLTQKFAGVR